MKKYKNKWVFLKLVGSLSVFLALFFIAKPAFAATDYVPVTEEQIAGAKLVFGSDRSTITATFPTVVVNGAKYLGGTVDFVDTDPTDSNYRYLPTTKFCSTGNNGGIWFGKNDSTDISNVKNPNFPSEVTAYVDLDYGSRGETAANVLDGCADNQTKNGTDSKKKGNYDLTVSNAGVLNYAFVWSSSGGEKVNLKTVAPIGEEGTIKWGSTNNLYFKPTVTDNILVYNHGTCSDYIVLKGTEPNQKANLYRLSGNFGQGSDAYLDATRFPDLKSLNLTESNCAVQSVNLWSANVGGYLGSDYAGTYPMLFNPTDGFNIGGTRGLKPSEGGDGSLSRTNVSSDGTGCSGSSLDWMICPVIDGISATADFVTDKVEGQLNFSVKDNLPNSVHKAWAIFKNLVSVIIVIVMLVMVLSQAFGDLISAYTFKKLLPKLVISVIAMQLSWDLCVWMIGLANDAGQGIAQLISLPFGGLNALNLQDLLHRLDGTTAIFTGLATGGGALVGVAAVGVITKGVMFKGLMTLGWPILTLAAVSVLISLVAALATLLFRNALIIILVILSPIGILAWVLPGSNRMWKMWKDNFSKTLIFFPLVMAMIYGGRIFAWIAGGLGASGPLDLLMVMLGFFGPYFLLPKSFKWGGSLLSQAAKGVDSSFPIKKSREVANKELMAAQKRSQNAVVDRYYRHIMRGEENGPVGRMGRFRHRFINGVIRTAGGHPIPTARSTRVMDQEVGKWKHDEIDLIEGRVGSDYKEFQKLPGMTVQRAKELVRDKYWGKGDKMDKRGFLTWAYNTKSFMEFGQPEWREGYSKDPVTGKMVPPKGGPWEDMVKTQDWIDFMHGNGQAYGDIGQRLGAFVPYRLPLGGGPKPEDFLPEERDADGKVIRELGEKYYEWEKDENGTPIVVDGKKVPVTKQVAPGVSVPVLTAEAKLAGGNMQIATLIADSARFEKAIDQAEDPSAIPGWRPEHFEELLHITEALAPKGADGKAHRELIKEVKIDENGNQVEAEVEKGRLIGLENSPGAVELDKFIQEQSRTLAGRNLLQRLSGSAGVHIDSLFGKGYLQSMLERRTGEELNGGGGNGGATPAPVQPKPPKPQPPDTLIVKQGEESKAKGEGSGGGAKEGGPPSEVNLKIDHKALEQTIENSTRIGARRGTLQAFRALKKAGYLGAPPQTGSTAPQEPTDQTPPEEPPKPA